MPVFRKNRIKLSNKFLIYVFIIITISLGTFLVLHNFHSKHAEEIEVVLGDKTAPLKKIETAYYDLNVYRIKNYLPEGHLEVIKENSRDVELLYLTLASPTKLMSINVNNNSGVIKKRVLGEINDSFRGGDILISSSLKKIFISYISVDGVGCASVNVGELSSNYQSSFALKSIFKTPCFMPPYGLHQSGLKMAEDNFGNLYLAVGDFQKPYLAQDDTSFLGKILIKTPKTNKFSIFSKGHRNPQGLYFDQEKARLVETEHGPAGGDEINLIRRGANYGWPFVTYGKPHGQAEIEWFSKNSFARYGNHDNYAKPVYSFVPSIGIKAITKVKPNSEASLWANNYLLVSGASASLFLIKMEGEAVMFSERIPIFRKSLRDLAVTNDGTIFISAEDFFVIKPSATP